MHIQYNARCCIKIRNSLKIFLSEICIVFVRATNFCLQSRDLVYQVAPAGRFCWLKSSYYQIMSCSIIAILSLLLGAYGHDTKVHTYYILYYYYAASCYMYYLLERLTSVQLKNSSVNFIVLIQFVHRNLNTKRNWIIYHQLSHPSKMLGQ